MGLRKFIGKSITPPNPVGLVYNPPNAIPAFGVDLAECHMCIRCLFCGKTNGSSYHYLLISRIQGIFHITVLIKNDSKIYDK